VLELVEELVLLLLAQRPTTTCLLAAQWLHRNAQIATGPDIEGLKANAGGKRRQPRSSVIILISCHFG
jgi:hypothetical protein